MELEEMKTLWMEMSAEVEKQKKVTNSLIIKMTEVNYKNKLGKILIPEAIGSLFCLGEALYVLANFEKLNNWYLMVCGGVAVVILFVLPLLSIRAICNLWSFNIVDSNYKQSLMVYSKSKTQFALVQKVSFYLGSILLVVILPVMVKLITGADFFKVTRSWLWYAISFPMFYYCAKWTFKSYNKTIEHAQNIWKELEI